MRSGPARIVLAPVEVTRLRGMLVVRRQALGLSQEDLDWQLGCADRLVGKWERGTHTPTLASFCAWADSLGLRIELVDRGERPEGGR